MICNVRDVSPRVVAIMGTGLPLATTELPRNLFEILEEWLQTWMWDFLHWVGNIDLLLEATDERTCLAVIDGLFMKETFPRGKLDCICL